MLQCKNDEYARVFYEKKLHDDESKLKFRDLDLLISQYLHEKIRYIEAKSTVNLEAFFDNIDNIRNF